MPGRLVVDHQRIPAVAFLILVELTSAARRFLKTQWSDIVVSVDQTPDDLMVFLNYWDSHIPENTAAELARTFDTILSCFVTDQLLKPCDVRKILHGDLRGADS